MIQRTTTFAVAAAAMLTAGCFGDSGPPTPAPVDSVTVPDPVEPGVKRRSVSLRSPLGKTVGNLLIDGDFESSIIIRGTSAQSGWLAFANGGGYLRGETGGLCRSGLRCGMLRSGVLLFGQGAAARDAAMIARVYSRPPEGAACNVTTAQILRCNAFSSVANLPSETEMPGPDGWCVHRGRIGKTTFGLCMLLETSLADATVIVDDAALLPDNGTTPLSSRGIPDASFVTLSKPRQERVRALLEWRRQRMKFGTPLTDYPDMGRN